MVNIFCKAIYKIYLFFSFFYRWGITPSIEITRNVFGGTSFKFRYNVLRVFGVPFRIAKNSKYVCSVGNIHVFAICKNVKSHCMAGLDYMYRPINRIKISEIFKDVSGIVSRHIEDIANSNLLFVNSSEFSDLQDYDEVGRRIRAGQIVQKVQSVLGKKKGVIVILGDTIKVLPKRQ